MFRKYSWNTYRVQTMHYKYFRPIQAWKKWFSSTILCLCTGLEKVATEHNWASFIGSLSFLTARDKWEEGETLLSLIFSLAVRDLCWQGTLSCATIRCWLQVKKVNHSFTLGVHLSRYLFKGAVSRNFFTWRLRSCIHITMTNYQLSSIIFFKHRI